MDSIQRELRSPVGHNFSSNMAVGGVQVVTLAHVGLEGGGGGFVLNVVRVSVGVGVQIVLSSVLIHRAHTPAIHIQQT